MDIQSAEPAFGTFRGPHAISTLRDLDFTEGERYVFKYTNALTKKKGEKSAETVEQLAELKKFVEQTKKSLKDTFLEIHEKRSYKKRELKPEQKQYQDEVRRSFLNAPRTQEILQKFQADDALAEDFAMSLEISPYMRPEEGYMVGQVPRFGYSPDAPERTLEAMYRVFLQFLATKAKEQGKYLDAPPRTSKHLDQPERQAEIKEWIKLLITNGDSDETILQKLLNIYRTIGMNEDKAKDFLKQVRSASLKASKKIAKEYVDVWMSRVSPVKTDHCDDCVSRHGMPISTVGTPPLHPNCVCRVGKVPANSGSDSYVEPVLEEDLPSADDDVLADEGEEKV